MQIDIHTHRLHPRTSLKEVLTVDAAGSNAERRIALLDGENLFKSLGIHPWSASKWNLDEFPQLKNDFLDSKVLLIGEIGLDKTCPVSLDTQKLIFNTQLDMAQQVVKPIILHVVHTMAEILESKKEHPGIPAWIIHGFRGGKQEAEQYIKKEFYLSFGAKFNPAGLKACPMDKLFLETDESDEGIGAIYERAANILECSVADLEVQIERNFCTVFRKE